MWLIVTAVIMLATTAGLYGTDKGRRLRGWVKYKHGKWKDLIQMVSSRHSGVMIYVISIKMLCQAGYADFISLFDNRVKKIGDKLYEVSYYVEGNMYRFPVKVRRGPSNVVDIQDNEGNDLFLRLGEYMGPNGILSNPLVTPNFLGCDSIIVETFEDSKTFSGDEMIEIS